MAASPAAASTTIRTRPAHADPSVRIVFDSEAAKTLRRSPERKRLLQKIRQLATDPAELANNVTRLVGRSESRLRVGNWRIIFHIEGETLYIDAIGPRGSVYG